MDNVERLSVRAVTVPQVEVVEQPTPPDVSAIVSAIQSVADKAASQAAARQSNALISAWLGIGTVLAIRLLLLLALLGSFALAVMAMQRETNAALFVLIAYAVLVVLPLVYLSRFSRSEGKSDA